LATAHLFLSLLNLEVAIDYYFCTVFSYHDRKKSDGKTQISR
jgi:hypothetical protein